MSAALLAALHVHHHFHGSSLDYVAIGLAAAASWVGVPGPGEPVLISAGVLAARGRLDLAEVLAVAWAGAVAGGVAGWVLGHRAGRALMSARGPLLHQREKALARGERFFSRYGILAVYFAPSWVAGSTGMGGSRFLPANAVSGLIWTLLVGGGAYVVGPPITEVVDDVGLLGVLLLAGLVAAGLIVTLRRRRRRRRR
jgi:membrane protein DedA with SNARE-associated domain